MSSRDHIKGRCLLCKQLFQSQRVFSFGNKKRSYSDSAAQTATKRQSFETTIIVVVTGLAASVTTLQQPPLSFWVVSPMTRLYSPSYMYIYIYVYITILWKNESDATYAGHYRSILIGESRKEGISYQKRDKLMLMQNCYAGMRGGVSRLCPIQPFYIPRATAATIVSSTKIQCRVNEKFCHQRQVKLILISIMTLKTSENLNTLSIIVSLCFICVFCIRYLLHGTNQYFYCFHL